MTLHILTANIKNSMQKFRYFNLYSPWQLIKFLYFFLNFLSEILNKKICGIIIVSNGGGIIMEVLEILQKQNDTNLPEYNYITIYED